MALAEELQSQIKTTMRSLKEGMGMWERVYRDGQRFLDLQNKADRAHAAFCESLGAAWQHSQAKPFLGNLEAGGDKLVDVLGALHVARTDATTALSDRLLGELKKKLADWRGQAHELSDGLKAAKQVIKRQAKAAKAKSKSNKKAKSAQAVEKSPEEWYRDLWRLGLTHERRRWCSFLGDAADALIATEQQYAHLVQVLRDEGGPAQWMLHATEPEAPEALPTETRLLLGETGEPQDGGSPDTSGRRKKHRRRRRRTKKKKKKKKDKGKKKGKTASSGSSSSSSSGPSSSSSSSSGSSSSGSPSSSSSSSPAASSPAKGEEQQETPPPPCWWASAGVSHRRYLPLLLPDESMLPVDVAMRDDHLMHCVTQAQARWRGAVARASLGSPGGRPLRGWLGMQRRRKVRVEVPVSNAVLWHDPYDDRNIRNQILDIHFELLIHKMTQPHVEATDLRAIFILQYRTFVSPTGLLEALVARFHARLADAPLMDETPQSSSPAHAPAIPAPSDGGRRSILCAETGLVHETQLCVLSFIAQWVADAPDTFAHGGALVMGLLAFLGPLRAAPATSVAIKTKVDAILAGLGEGRTVYVRRWRQAQFNELRQEDNTIHDAPPSLLQDTTGVVQCLEDMHSVEIARQLTVMDASLFKQIQGWEFLEQRWTEDDVRARHESPNLMRLIDRFNHTCRWTATEILRRDTTEARALVICKLVDVGTALLELSNFSSLMALLSALQSAAIARLQYTWERVPEQTHALLEDLLAVMSMSFNYRAYRERLAECTQAVPYIGLTLQDLTFTDEGNAATIAQGRLVNVTKLRATTDIIRTTLAHAQGELALHPVPPLLHYLGYDRGITSAAPVAAVWDENEQYRVSREIEPRGMQAPKKKDRKPVAHTPDPAPDAGQQSVTAANSGAVEALLSQMMVMVYRSGQMIIEGGAEATELYFLSDGMVRVELPDGTTVPLNRGCFFGEMAAFLGSGRRCASIRAITDVQVLVLSEEAVEEIMEADPVISQLMRELGQSRFIANNATLQGGSGVGVGGGSPGSGGSRSASWRSQQADDLAFDSGSLRRGVRMATLKRRRRTPA